MWLGAALADCLPPPWLAGHTAGVCIGGVPPTIIAVDMVVVVVGGARCSELH